MPIFRTTLVVVLTIVAWVAGAPSRGQDDSIAGYMDAVLDAIDDKSRTLQEKILNEKPRNLDQIGGGNLLRNLDHIGGGNLLRNVLDNSDKSKFFNNYKFNSVGKTLNSPELIMTEKNSDYFNPRGLTVIDESDLIPWYQDNTGGNLLQDPQINKYDRTRWSRDLSVTNDTQNKQKSTGSKHLIRLGRMVESSDMPHSKSSIINDDRLNYDGLKFISYADYINQKNRGNGFVDTMDGANLGQRDIELNEKQRNLDQIGGGNLLRNINDQREYRIIRLNE